MYPYDWFCGPGSHIVELCGHFFRRQQSVRLRNSVVVSPPAPAGNQPQTPSRNQARSASAPAPGCLCTRVPPAAWRRPSASAPWSGRSCCRTERPSPAGLRSSASAPGPHRTGWRCSRTWSGWASRWPWPSCCWPSPERPWGCRTLRHSHTRAAPLSSKRQPSRFKHPHDRVY